MSLRLEPRIDDFTSDDEDEDTDGVISNPFHVLLGYSNHITLTQMDLLTQPPWYWEEVDVRLTLRHPESPVATIPLNTAKSKGVRFATEAKKAVAAALEPVPNLRPIRNLCKAIQELKRPQRDTCFELLVAEIGKQKYGIRIYPQNDAPPDPNLLSISSLQNILRDPKFTKQARLRLAVTLASSVLQLHNTPWIERSLEKENIFFLQRSTNPTYDDPFICRTVDKTHQANPSGSMPGLMSRIIRNQTLYSLGVLLIEIWYGKTLDELHLPEDGPLHTQDTPQQAIARWNTADRLLNDLYDEAGAKYTEAVRRCIRCDFADGLASDLDNVNFQNAVYQGVVFQLKENLDFLY